MKDNIARRSSNKVPHSVITCSGRGVCDLRSDLARKIHCIEIVDACRFEKYVFIAGITCQEKILNTMSQKVVSTNSCEIDALLALAELSQ